MQQSAFTVLTSVDPGQVDELRRLLSEIQADLGGNPHLRLGELDDLHYAALVVVDVDGSRPYLIFEGNVDGRVDRFLERLLHCAGDGVDAVYRHCTGYPTRSAGDPAAALSYLQAHDIGADTFYVNRPGRTVRDIRQEQGLRDHVERFVDEQGPDLRRLDPETVRQRIGASLPDHMRWARTPAPTPFLVKNSMDARGVFALVLALPVLALLGLVRTAFGRSSGRGRSRLAKLALAAVVGLVAWAVQLLRQEEGDDERTDRQRARDWQDAYADWAVHEQQLADLEDRQVQNHMASITTIKPGWLRFSILRVVLWVLNLVARLTANRGTLGGITSIHFARWVITPDRSLLFLSNFDGSWESYLNDFIDRAAVGLTAVWSNTTNEVGFPATRWLVQGGARTADRFKAYARSSMVPTDVWYSAYPDIAASNIGNNMQLRDGMFAPPDPSTTDAWLRRV